MSDTTYERSLADEGRQMAADANNRAVREAGMGNPVRGPLSDRIDISNRFRCLELALGACNSGLVADPVREAERYLAFVTDKDGRNVRTTVLDALNQAGVD